MSKQKRNTVKIINLPKRCQSDSNDTSDSSDSESSSSSTSVTSTTTSTSQKPILNYDPLKSFADTIFIGNKCPLDIDDEEQVQTENIHIRVQQRRASSYITTVQGLSTKLDLKVILKALKHTLHCNGSITKDPEHGNVVQLSGDQREHVKAFLIDEGICEKNQIVMHGF